MCQGATSTPQHLTFGVPQGTRMGSPCFLMLINDATTDTNTRWEYVDDTTMATTINKSQPDYSHLQTLLDSTHGPPSTRPPSAKKRPPLCTFTPPHIPPPFPPSRLMAAPFQVVNSIKLLDLTIVSTWNQHVISLVQAATYQLFLLRTLRKLGAPASELVICVLHIHIP